MELQLDGGWAMLVPLTRNNFLGLQPCRWEGKRFIVWCHILDYKGPVDMLNAPAMGVSNEEEIDSLIARLQAWRSNRFEPPLEDQSKLKAEFVIDEFTREMNKE